MATRLKGNNLGLVFLLTGLQLLASCRLKEPVFEINIVVMGFFNFEDFNVYRFVLKLVIY